MSAFCSGVLDYDINILTVFIVKNGRKNAVKLMLKLEKNNN